MDVDDSMQERADRWASTMAGAGEQAGVRLAHADSHAIGAGRRSGALARQELEHELLVSSATRAVGAGDRRRPEEPDEWRTCFERDRDRILHAAAFRRLAGKTQVFVFPDDHQRTRLTHALEVAQVATSVARALGLNVALTEAIALGHDCGHGPGGHASEDALSPYVAGGYDHAVWGADVTLAPLNLCAETLDGIRNHSWSRPAPATPEGEVVSWADRIAYVCHDFEDAVAAGIVAADMLPPSVAARCGSARSRQLGAFIRAMVDAAAETGRIGMTDAARRRARRVPPLQLRARLPAPGQPGPGRRRDRAAAGARRALRRPPAPAPRPAARRRRHRRGGRRRRVLRRRDDRPLRLPPGRVAARLGPGQAAPASSDLADPQLFS